MSIKQTELRIKNDPDPEKLITQTQILSNEIETELRQIESDWNSKFRITKTQETKEQISSIQGCMDYELEVVENIKEDFQDSLKERSELLRQKFLDSMDIHKKPIDFTILKKIFLFKVIDATGMENGKEFGQGNILYNIDENSLKQLLFIEYIVQRINELISPRTRAYLLEKEPKTKPTVSEEREREEYFGKCDKYVAKKTAMFSDLDFDNGDAKFIYNSKIPVNKTDDDNGEQEMLAKLKEFESLIQSNPVEKTDSQILSENIKEESDAKRPLPDYEKLKEEAIQQQLKIREFFMGSSTGKKNMDEATVIDENDTNGYEFNQNMIIKIKETNEEIVRVFPTIDSKSQVEIRRKIFYDKLVI